MPRLLPRNPHPAALTYTLRDATLLSSLSEATLRRLAHEEKLRLIRVGGRTMVCGESLRALLSGGSAKAAA